MVTALLALGPSDPGVRRAFVWYGKSILRLVTLGRYPDDDLGPLERAVVGTAGFLGSVGVLVYLIFTVAS